MDLENKILSDYTVLRLDQLLENQSLKSPKKTAIKHGSVTYNYQDLNDISGKLASYFKEREIHEGSVAAIALGRSPQLIIVLLALVKAGATYLPIDIDLPVNRINYMLNDSGADFLITSDTFEIDTGPNLVTIFTEEALKQCVNYEVNDHHINTSVDSLAYILYTSGSTGKPKGVQVKKSAFLNLLLSIQQAPGINSNDVVLATTTISFDIAAVEIFLPLMSGATLVLADAGTVKDGRLLINIAQKEGITIMQGTPAMWRNMLNSGWKDHLAIKAFCGGEAMPRDFIKNILPKCNELWNMYGPTETAIYSIIKKITIEDAIITIGKPIANTDVYILDEAENPVRTNVIGELYIGGAGVALGYVNNPKLTAEKFTANKFSSAGKMYRTGDLARCLKNGDIEYLGRADQQIKVRGFRIEPGEIEYNLKAIDGIKDALVTSFQDFLFNTHLGVYIVLENAGPVADTVRATMWKAELKRSLPDYMIPDTFLVVDTIPRLANGKIDRNALPVLSIGHNIGTDFKEAGTDTEVLLSDIFLKHIAVKAIGINDNFFELGLDSLTAVRIMVQIEQELCKRLPLSTLIQHPTLKKLAAFLDENAAPQYKCLVPIKPKGDKMPLYIVHGIGLNIMNLYSMVSYMDEQQPVYGLQPLGLEGDATPLDNMEDIAGLYVSEILAHNPAGPYAIAGYSFGGYIAYEMARQLKVMGKDLVMLGMFDSNIQRYYTKSTLAKKLGAKLARQLSKISFRAVTIIHHPGLTAAYMKVHLRNELGRLMVNTGLKKVYNPDKLPAFMLVIIKKLETAFKNYQFRPLDVKIDLFKAAVRMYYVDDPGFLGWGKLALKGIDVYNVPGDHKHMFSPPNDQILAQVLQQKLDEINGDAQHVNS